MPKVVVIIILFAVAVFSTVASMLSAPYKKSPGGTVTDLSRDVGRTLKKLNPLGAPARNAFRGLPGRNSRPDKNDFSQTQRLAMEGADLAGRSFQERNFNNFMLTGTNFTNAILKDANFEAAQAQNAKFTNARLGKVVMSAGVFSGADFSDAHLVGATARAARFARASFRLADLSEAHFSGADLSKADLTGVFAINTRFPTAVLTGAIFDNANLHGTDFKRADLTGVSFNGADVTLADFSDTIVSGADFSGAINLRQSQLFGACGNEKTRLPFDLDLPDCGQR